MKKIISITVIGVLMASVAFAAGQKQESASAGAKKAAFHIGVVTGTVSQSEDDLRGAEELIKRYGKANEGGMIQHVTYPDQFMDQQETVITQIVSLADDPLMKAVVVNQSIPGTAEAMKRIREKRPDILLLAGEPHEDPLVIQAAADLALSNHHLGRQATRREDLRAHFLPPPHVL